MEPNTTPAPETKSGDTVTVACKMPHGIELRAYRMVEAAEPSPGGSRLVQKAEQIPGSFTVMGNSYPEGGAPRASRMEGGYALTPGVPKKLWEQWLADNKDSPMVRNGLIFAHGSERNALAEAREKEKVKSGFERLDPAALPGGIKRATEDAAA
jgi:hypothetical protein